MTSVILPDADTGGLSWNAGSYNPKTGKVKDAFDSEPQLTWEVATGLRKSDQAMVDAVNKVLDKLLEDGSISRIYARHGLEQRLR